MCPNFRHPALTPSLIIKYKFLQVQNSFATIVNELSFLQLFAYIIDKVRKPRMTKLRHGVPSQGILPNVLCIKVVGALVNAVFLFALCFSIFVEAIKE